MDDSDLLMALNRAEESLKKLAGSRVRFQKTNTSGVFCSRLPPHWRSNKSLQFPFAIISLRPLPDGTKVAVYAGNEENCGADVKNNTAEFVSQLARFSDLRFVGKSGRGKSFNLTITIYTQPVQHVVTVPGAIKVTVDGPRDSRNPAKQLMNELGGCRTTLLPAASVAAAAAYRRFHPPNFPTPFPTSSAATCTSMFNHQTQFTQPLMQNFLPSATIEAGGASGAPTGSRSVGPIPPSASTASSSGAELLGGLRPPAPQSRSVFPSPLQSPVSPLLAELLRLYAMSTLVSNLFTGASVSPASSAIGVSRVGVSGTKLAVASASSNDHSPTFASNTSRGSEESWGGEDAVSIPMSATKRRHDSMHEGRSSPRLKKIRVSAEKNLWRPYDTATQ